MQLTTENTKEFIEFWNNNKPEKFIHPMHEGIATVILDYLDQAEYQLTLEDNKVTIFDQQTNEELGEYTPEELFWKARLLIESNDKDSRSSTNHYNNLLDIFSNKELSPKEYKEQIRDELQNYYLTNECFNKNDELKWNSINYTTKNWIEIENIYYEYEETRGFLSIGDSLTDLEEEYGENNFPEKAVEDGKLKIFDVYANDVEDYLREKYNLKDSEEINEILGDYEYKTEDLLKYYIPNLSNENAELLSVIIDTQYIYLDHLPSITFENIYNKIDKSKLNEVQLEELNKIKEELSKPTVEIFKQSFDSFIMSLSEAASKSIQRDIEKLNAKAFYVFNVDNNEYTIVSKRDGENPFMVHKYYPENETGGIHHGSYDIDTYENAEKIAANRLIDEHKEKYELINFIAGTREEDFNLELKNELFSVFEYLNKYSLTEENKIELIDVKAYQYEGPSGKLKVLVEYKGNCREDDLFNLLHDDEENGQDGHDYEINGYKLDLNPIKAEKSGTISEYLAMLKNVEKKWPEVNKLINEQKENVMYKKIHSKDPNGVERWYEYDNKGNEIHYKNSDGFEKWTDYDDKGKVIHFKNSDGVEGWTEYDDKGNVIHYKNSSGFEQWYEYDDKGNVIHYKNSDGFEKWTDYDDKGNVIHYKNSDGDEHWNEYDGKGNEIHYKDSDGYEKWYEYDGKGNEIYFKDSNGVERWYEYDNKGNEIHYKNSDGFEKWTDYDDKGNEIYFKDSNGVECWSEYDEKDNLIHYKNSDGVERWYEYDEKSNVIHFNNSDGYEKWYEYDEKGNEIHYKDSNGFERSSTVEYVSKEQYLQEKNESIQEKVSNEPLTFGQFNSETNEIKLIKEAYFKELVIDENDASKKKVVLGFKENDQEQLLEMGEVEYKNLLNAFGFSKEQQENTLEINKYKTFAEEKPEVVFDMIKSDYFGGTPFSDNELIGYLKGLKKSNNYHHYLDELLFESLEQSDESLFSKVIDAGADITWRREENGEPINILHYAAADNLDIAIKKIIEKTKSLEVDDYINLFSEENFEGHTPLEIAISNSDGQYFESTKLLIDAMDGKGFSGVNDLLIEDKLGNKVLYTSKNNLDFVSILCFDGNNNIISADTESLVDEKSLGEIVSQDLIYQTNNDFIKGNIELNRSSKLISELKEVPQKLWDDEINYKLLHDIPNQFDPRQDFYLDFKSLIEIESIKRFLKNEFNEAKESILQGRFTKDKFIEVFEKTDIQDFFSKTEELSELKKFFNDDNWSPAYDVYKKRIAEVLWENEIENLIESISPKPFYLEYPSLQFMLKNEDSECFLNRFFKKNTDVIIDEIQASILLKYLQYEDWNFYKSVGDKVCILDVSEDFIGEGKEISTKEIVDFAYRMMVKARDEEYSIYDVKDEEVFNDLRNKFGLIEEQKIKSSKDEELKKQETSVVKQFFTKLKDSICDNAKLEDVLKSAASVLQTFSDTEKKEISQYLRNKDASLGNSSNGLSSILEITEPGQKKKRSKADDDTRGM